MLHNIATKGGMEIEVSESDSEDENQQVPHRRAAQGASAAEERRRRLDITQNYFRGTAHGASVPLDHPRHHLVGPPAMF